MRQEGQRPGSLPLRSLSRRRLHTQVALATCRTLPAVKDVPAQEFVIALAQYFRSTGKVRLASAITRLPVKISRGERRLGALDTTAATRRRKENTRERPRRFDSQWVYPRVALATMRFGSHRSRVRSHFRVSHRRVCFRVCGAGPCFPRALARMCGRAQIDGDRVRRRQTSTLPS